MSPHKQTDFRRAVQRDRAELHHHPCGDCGGGFQFLFHVRAYSGVVMLRVSGGPGEGASFQSRQSDSDKSSALQTESDDNGWFRKPARDLLGSDPGLALHVLLEIAPASGYRYASGERSMPLNQFRRLVHGKQGKQWLAAFMDGCAEPWWLEYRRAASIGERVLEMTKRE